MALLVILILLALAWALLAGRGQAHDDWADDEDEAYAYLQQSDPGP